MNNYFVLLAVAAAAVVAAGLISETLAWCHPHHADCRIGGVF